MLDELRHALRSLRTERRLVVMTALSVALGVGVLSALAVLLFRIVLAPLPYPNADRLVEISDRWQGTPRAPLTAPEFFALRDEVEAFDAVAAYVHDP